MNDEPDDPDIEFLEQTRRETEEEITRLRKEQADLRDMAKWLSTGWSLYGWNSARVVTFVDTLGRHWPIDGTLFDLLEELVERRKKDHEQYADQKEEWAQEEDDDNE